MTTLSVCSLVRISPQCAQLYLLLRELTRLGWLCAIRTGSVLAQVLVLVEIRTMQDRLCRVKRRNGRVIRDRPELVCDKGNTDTLTHGYACTQTHTDTCAYI